MDDAAAVAGAQLVDAGRAVVDVKLSVFVGGAASRLAEPGAVDLVGQSGARLERFVEDLHVQKRSVLERRMVGRDLLGQHRIGGKVEPAFVAYLGGYYQWSNNWKLSGRFGIQNFGGAEIAGGLIRAKAFTQPTVRLDLERMDPRSRARYCGAPR